MRKMPLYKLLATLAQGASRSPTRRPFLMQYANMYWHRKRIKRRGTSIETRIGLHMIIPQRDPNFNRDYWVHGRKTVATIRKQKKLINTYQLLKDSIGVVYR